MKTDSQIQKDVMEELKWEPSVSHEHIGVSVSDGIVTLSGSVPSFIEKYHADKAAQRVLGVKAIVEKIEVKLPSSLIRDDQEIAKAIVNQFQWSSLVPDDKIKAKVSDGWVTLTGEVTWEYQRKAAEKLVRELTGVKFITNGIVIKPKLVAADLKEKIEQALKRAAERESKQIEIDVNGTHVTLSGQVRSFAEMSCLGRAWSH
jgi:osmotically-inducible protein OsmY